MSIFSKLKQINDIRSKAKQLQEALAKESVEGTAGWGKVKVTINGNQQILGVSIDEAAMSDRAALEGMVRDATNDAIKKIQQTMATKLKDIGGLDLAKEMGDVMNQG